MRKIVFNWYRGPGNTVQQEVEFEDGTSEEKIKEKFKEWVWEMIGEDFWWSEEN
ncbi:hypothetical protein [Paenibacillus sp. 1P03SA]|uniref:hypothetical protein n=1 Tax=Paenibacillus sp. 1P03SA TaxID=3132294 RepID=UPI0039A140AE